MLLLLAQSSYCTPSIHFPWSKEVKKNISRLCWVSETGLWTVGGSAGRSKAERSSMRKELKFVLDVVVGDP